jgi:uncharacterized integral membrane protein
MSTQSTTGSGGSRGSGGRGGRSRSEQIRLILAGLLGGLTVAFALLNLNRVEVDWIFGTWQTPLTLVIAVSLLVGALGGYAYGRRSRRSSKGSGTQSSSGRG